MPRQPKSLLEEAQNALGIPEHMIGQARKEPARRNERVDGKKTAKIFKAFREGAKLSDVIVRYKVTPQAARNLRTAFEKFEAEGKAPTPQAVPESPPTPSAYELTVENELVAGDGEERLNLRLVISVELGSKPSKTFDLVSEWYDSETVEGKLINSHDNAKGTQNESE